MSRSIVADRFGTFRRLKRHPATWLALIAYVPALLQEPGRVSADTKTYLYLDPWTLIAEAARAWDPSTGAGMVTHQKVGYLWPMGPYYLLMDLVRCPDWVAQRIWWGSLLFLAALGVYALARRLEFVQSAAFIAGLSYSLSPYFLQYLARVSGLLLPWAGLPWLLYTAVRAREERTWRWPLVTGLIVASVGSLNATTIAMVMLGWFIWVFADILGGVTGWRSALGYLFKSSVAILALNLWWMVALVVQGGYGVPILRYTEAYEIIAAASTPLEVLRGLGYWFFYGGEPREPWVGPASDYLQNRIILVTTFVGVGVALVSVVLYKGRSRLNMALLMVVGLGVAVGSTPWDSPSPYGRLFRTFVGTDLGGALRSAPRAAPLVIVVLALGVGWCAAGARDVLSVRRPGGLPAAAVVPGIVLLIGVNAFPWFTGRALTDWIVRDENVPAYWTEAARAIDSTADPDTGIARTYEFPGIPFASYVWGGTIDPITPGLVESDVVAREQVPIGSEATMDLLSAVESRLQEGRADRRLITDFARLISATAVDWRGDLRHLDYSTPSPAQMEAAFPSLVQGTPLFVGGGRVVTDDEFVADRRYYVRPRAESHPDVAVWAVDTPRALVTVSPPSQVTVVAGSGQGVVDALAADVLDPLDTFVYEASRRFMGDDTNVSTPEHFILTDTNRRAARSWASVSRTEGRTEQATEVAPPTRQDSRLMPFVDDATLKPSVDEQTVSVLVGAVKRTSTNMYGSEFGFLPEDRAENLVDGDLSTAWRTGGQGEAIGNRWTIVYAEDQRASTLTIVAAIGARSGRPITAGIVTLLDGSNSVVRELEYRPAGRRSVVLKFPSTTFRSIQFQITGDKWTDDGLYINQPTTGLAEITPGTSDSGAMTPTREFLRLPVSSADIQGAARRLSIVMTRWRNDAEDVERSDPETALRRRFMLVSQRSLHGWSSA